MLLWDTPHFNSIFHTPHTYYARATFKELSVYSLGLALQHLHPCRQTWAKVAMAEEIGQDHMTIGTIGGIDTTVRTTINDGTIQVEESAVLAVWQGTSKICWEKLLRLAR